ncbi:hypothetical protein [Thiocapsa imhoffii]|uniref:hypothetical protein n=1 Tax=Thiocapsa imhoffii TaxID=382777 RepID=UPI001F5B1F78|nr:hypothetical protein [Thiocapsa imhoffii]
MELVVRYDDTINADSTTIALFDQLLLAYAYAACIYVICDNGTESGRGGESSGL